MPVHNADIARLFDEIADLLELEDENPFRIRAYRNAARVVGELSLDIAAHQALKTWSGREVVDSLREGGILIRTRSMRGVAEEAPGAYKDVDLVAASTEGAGLARRVAFLRPMICIKG